MPRLTTAALLEFITAQGSLGVIDVEVQGNRVELTQAGTARKIVITDGRTYEPADDRPVELPKPGAD